MRLFSPAFALLKPHSASAFRMIALLASLLSCGSVPAPSSKPVAGLVPRIPTRSTNRVLANAYGDSIVLEADTLGVYQLAMLRSIGIGGGEMRALDTPRKAADLPVLTPAKRVLFFSIHSSRHVGALVRPAADGMSSRGALDSLFARYSRHRGDLDRLPSDAQIEYAWKYPADWYRRAYVQPPASANDLLEIIWIASGPDDVPPPMQPIQMNGTVTWKELGEIEARHAGSHPATRNDPPRIIGRALVDLVSNWVLEAEGEKP